MGLVLTFIGNLLAASWINIVAIGATLVSVIATILMSRIGQVMAALIVGVTLGYWQADANFRGEERFNKLKADAAMTVLRTRIATEIKRRDAIIQNAAEIARVDAEALEKKESELEALQKEIDNVSRVNARRRPCVDANGVRRLNSIR